MCFIPLSVIQLSAKDTHSSALTFQSFILIIFVVVVFFIHLDDMIAFKRKLFIPTNCILSNRIEVNLGCFNLDEKKTVVVCFSIMCIECANTE